MASQSRTRFVVERELARGGMGVVYAAHDTAHDRPVALKRLIGHPTPRMAALFEREFYVLSSLRHPRIIEAYEYDVDDAGPFYTMELLPGADLAELSPMDVRTACRYLRDVASSLSLLHTRRLLHRDVSPRNVRTTLDGGCKLIDFGALASFGTAEGAVGTPSAMAPEALFGRPLDQRADLFSLGTLAYFLLTGQRAYPARRIHELPELFGKRVLPPSTYASAVPADLDKLVLSLLSLDVLARPSSATVVIEHLNTIASLDPDPDARAARAYLFGTSFVDRDKELERALRRIKRLKSGDGSALYIEGGAGSGKTRFLTEVALSAQVSGCLVLGTDAAEHADATSMAHALLQRLARLSPEQAVEALCPHLPVVAALFPEIVAELGLHAPEGAPLGDREAREVVPATFCAALVRAARDRGLVLTVDNLQAVDRESAAMLLSLARATREQRIATFMAAEPSALDALPPAVESIREAGASLVLRELSKNGVLALMRSTFGDAPHLRRAAARLHAATDGNPDECMRLMQGWVAEGHVSYSAGTWSLPIEIPHSALEGVARTRTRSLDEFSREHRAILEFLSVLVRPAPLDLCVQSMGQGCDRREVIASLEGLRARDVLTLGAEGYRLRQEGLRAAVLASLTEAGHRVAHLRVGRALLEAYPGDLAEECTAGLHLIRGGAATEGADRVARAAKQMLLHRTGDRRALARATEAFAAALAVYRAENRENLERLYLLVPLALASYDVSFDLAHDYGDEALERLSAILGFSNLDPLNQETVIAALSRAPVLSEAEARLEDVPNVMILAGWLIRAAMALTAVASATIDRETEERCARHLEPFTHLGPNHIGAIAHQYCLLLTSLTTDRSRATRDGWLKLLEHLETCGLPESMTSWFRLGATFSLGVLESQRDDDALRARLGELERLRSPQALAMANQLRSLYHGYRGELALAEKFRDEVEAYAVQYGSAWQIEVWSTCALSGIYGRTRDSAGNKRTVEQLDRLRRRLPTLTPFYERAVALQALMTGDVRRAVEILERELESSAPRERIGWTAIRGTLARAYGLLGEHEKAARICDETIAAAADDIDFVALNLRTWIERAIACAEAGNFTTAKEQLAELFERFTVNQSPITLGSLHQARAHVACLEGDLTAFEHHLTAMETWFRGTGNPALLAQCDELRRMKERRHPDPYMQIASPDVEALTRTTALPESVFAECQGAFERRHRALELVAERSGADRAWLFAVTDTFEPVLTGALQVEAPPDDLMHQLTVFLRQTLDYEDETECLETADHIAITRVDAIPPYRLLPLTTAAESTATLVGVVAVALGPGVRGVEPAFLSEIARQLHQSGDLTPVQMLG
jgi:tetratricopeptide (TPR) repeat protein